MKNEHVIMDIRTGELHVINLVWQTVMWLRMNLTKNAEYLGEL